MECHIRPEEVALTLSESDLQQLTATARLSQTLEFGPDPDHHLTLALHLQPDATALRAAHSPGNIAITIPTQQLEEWSRSGRPFVSNTQPTYNGNPLRVTLERQPQSAPSQPTNPRDDAHADERFRTALRRLDEHAQSRPNPEQMSIENEPATDI